MQKETTKDEGLTSSPNDSNAMLAAAFSVELGNEMIAEFMCGQRFEFMDEFDRECAGVKVNDSVYPLNKLEYHSSWDWLMPVVEKIENSGTYSVEIDKYKCSITYVRLWNNKRLCYHEKIEKTKIEIVWLCVVEFIYWYNGKNAVSER